MDPSLYRAAMEGKVDGLMQHIDQLEVQVTPNNNTVLHVAAQFGHLQCVAKILGKCPMLLNQVNMKGETPLHIAAREGHSDIVKALIETAKVLDLESGGGAAKELLRATNHIDKDTALHMAVRSRHYNLEVVKLLTSEDRESQYPPNNAEETPLYLAAERGYGDVVSEILETCTSPAYGGPGGRTALHAAAISCSKESTEKLLDWKQDLIKEADAHGWTPLHYAARCGYTAIVRLLLEKDKLAAYITTTEEKDDNKTALHIAATVGAVDVMKAILSHCPDTWEMVNSKGQSALHIAVETQEIDAIRFMLKQSWSSHLINQKDNIEGNTPLHLVGRPNASYLYRKLPELRSHDWADWGGAFNNKNLTPLDVEMSADYEDHFLEWPIGGGRNIVNNDREMLSNIDKWKRVSRERKKEAEEAKKESKAQRKADTENFRKMGETHLIVATLIATVTFAAGFTLPGGYDGEKGPDKGMAVLVREAAFKAFVITNTIAVMCSTSSAFLNVTASIYSLEEDDKDYKMGKRYDAVFYLILIAMGAMTVAFVTGAYAVLAHSLGLAISTCLIGCLSFLIYSLELKNLVTYAKSKVA